MKLSHFSVKGLFHIFDYKFTISEDNQVFLITGPNGYGKTTILSILSSLHKCDLFYFYALPFDEINIKFEGSITICIKSIVQNIKETVDIARQSDRTLEFTWSQMGTPAAHLNLTDKIYNIAKRNYKSAQDRRPFYESSSFPSFEDYFANDPHNLESLFHGQEQALLFLMQLQTLNITIQNSNRLSKKMDREGHVVESIDQVSNALKTIMGDAYFKYLKEVNNSNNSLYDKLLIANKAFTEEEYKTKSEKLELKLKQLYDWGLTTEKIVRPFEEKHSEVLSIYMEELERNIQIYDRLYKQLQLFETLLNQKMFSNKQIKFSPNHGISAIMDYDSYPLDLRKLSSGEQHEIIMLFNAIFNTTTDSILLIDEPENSLHVAWQNTFVSDITTICKTLNAQVIIATHSPQIIGSRYKECYDLYVAQEEQQE
ncbi:MAG: AAA family ATPase [Bacteroidales bacterium]|nr:AAA family ATPase [Bacteroidales bacterium]